jgi:predicted Zn-dependent protease
MAGALLTLLALSEPALAHGPMHEQIALLDQEIAKSPRKAELYARRGELYRLHGDLDLAHTDFDRAAALDPALDIVDLSRGRLFLDANWPHSAKFVLDRFLNRHTNHVEALIARAQVQLKLGAPLAAADDYSAAIAHAADGKPDLYLERAHALTAAGDPHFAKALQGLDEGIRRLGPLVTLELYAIDLEARLKRYDDALTRLDTVSAQSPRKETWLARRGEILQQAGRPADACAAYRSALASIDALPPSRRNVPAMQELKKRVSEALAKAQAETGTGKK